MSQSVLPLWQRASSPFQYMYVSFPQHTLILFFVIDIDILSQASSLCDEERPLPVEEDKVSVEVGKDGEDTPGLRTWGNPIGQKTAQ